MPTEDPQETQTPSAPAETREEPGHDREVEVLRSILEKYGTAVISGIVAAILLVVGVSTWRGFKSDSAERAALALSEAATPEDFQGLLENFDDTPAAPVARLGLGAAHYRDGNFQEAREAYAGFVAANPDHTMAPAARIAEAQCMEAQGDVEASLEAFTAFLASRPEHYLAPYAALGKARCLAQDGQLEEARAAYEDILAAYPDSVWAFRSESDLDWVQRQLRAQR